MQSMSSKGYYFNRSWTDVVKKMLDYSHETMECFPPRVWIHPNPRIISVSLVTTQNNIFEISWFCILSFCIFNIYWLNQMDIRNRIHASRSIDWCNQNLYRISKSCYFERVFIFQKSYFFNNILIMFRVIVQK